MDEGTRHCHFCKGKIEVGEVYVEEHFHCMKERNPNDTIVLDACLKCHGNRNFIKINKGDSGMDDMVDSALLAFEAIQNKNLIEDMKKARAEGAGVIGVCINGKWIGVR